MSDSPGTLITSGAEALQHYEEAASLYRGMAEPLRLAHSVRHVGDILRNVGSIERAGPYYEEALKIYRDHGETVPLDLANTIRGFALLKGQAGHTEEARSLWLEARSLYASVDVQPGVKESYLHLASCEP